MKGVTSRLVMIDGGDWGCDEGGQLVECPSCGDQWSHELGDLDQQLFRCSCGVLVIVRRDEAVAAVQPEESKS